MSNAKMSDVEEPFMQIRVFSMALAILLKDFKLGEEQDWLYHGMNKINLVFVGTILLDLAKHDTYNAILKFRTRKVVIYGKLAYFSSFLCQPGLGGAEIIEKLDGIFAF